LIAKRDREAAQKDIARYEEMKRKSRHHVELVLDLRIAGRRGRRNGCRRRATGGSCFMTGGGGPQRNADLGIMAGLALSTLLVPVAAAEVQS